MRKQFIADILCVLVLIAGLVIDGFLFAHWAMSFGPNDPVPVFHFVVVMLLFMFVPAAIVAFINMRLQRWARNTQHG